MYEIKNKIFLDLNLSKTQKSALCNYLRALVKNAFSELKYNSPNITHTQIDIDKIFDKFIEDEQYYFQINSSRFEFLQAFIDNSQFISDAKLYLKECKKYYEYKQAQAPIIQAQKDFEKRKRKFLQDVKMSKDPPTKKQISYYNTLCKRHNIKKKETKNLSKLDLKNMIDEILNEYKTNCTNTD